MHSLAATNEVCTLPVYRPLIAFDKNDIICHIRKKSIPMRRPFQPYEDCCSDLCGEASGDETEPECDPTVGTAFGGED